MGVSVVAWLLFKLVLLVCLVGWLIGWCGVVGFGLCLVWWWVLACRLLFVYCGFWVLLMFVLLLLLVLWCM